MWRQQDRCGGLCIGCRKIAALLRTTSGWVVNNKRVQRLWRFEGLMVPTNRLLKNCY
jgi:hypothetical protein